MQKLSDSEWHVWNYLEQHLDQVPFLTISEVADKAYVSLSTVTRALKKSGYEGYIDYRQQIKNRKQETKIGDFSEKVTQAILKNEQEVNRTINLISPEDIEETIYLIDRAERVSLFANGVSTLVAAEMMNKLQLFGKQCVSYDDASYMLYYAKKMNENDLVFAISLSGETPELIPAIQTAKKNKAKIITLTATVPSTLVELADIYLPAYKSVLKNMNLGLDVASRIPLQIIGRIIFDAYAIYKSDGYLRVKK